ncbi:MAG: hypothetical protein AAF515_19410 [Pseudomonadota bacterium]
MKLLFHLHDLALGWYDGSNGSGGGDPGAAFIGTEGTLFGAEALASARLAPRAFNQDHWQALNADPLSQTAPGLQNNADLVYRHLQTLYEPWAGRNPEAVVIAVPGGHSTDQLGMLLGIAQEVGIPVCGFVDAALLYARTAALPERAYCIEVYLRRAVVTELSCADARLQRADATVVPRIGQLQLIDGWLDQLVDRFVADSRFDPLRVAETEQQLFDQVRAWLLDTRRDALAVEITHQGSTRAVRIEAEELLERAQVRYSEIERPLAPGSTVVLGPIAATLPGLAAFLSSRGHRTLDADERGLALSLTACPELFATSEAGVQFSSAVPYAATPAAPSPTLEPAATHFVDAEHLARPLDAFANGIAALDAAYGWRAPAASVRVNGAPVAPGRALVPGDVLEAGDERVTCIRLSDGT